MYPLLFQCTPQSTEEFDPVEQHLIDHEDDKKILVPSDRGDGKEGRKFLFETSGRFNMMRAGSPFNQRETRALLIAYVE